MITLGTNANIVSPVSPATNVKIIGVGGAGLALLEALASERKVPYECVAVHTDAQALLASSATGKVQLGRDASRGIGAGGDPMLGQASARESAEEIRSACNAPLVILCAGLGGGTGSGAAPVVAEEAARAGAMVVALVTLPFSVEGRKRREQARVALARLERHCVAVLCFENDRMSTMAPLDGPVGAAFAAASKVIADAAWSIVRMVGLPSVLRVGVAELAQIFRGVDARCQFGYGVATGPDRASEAVEFALGSPLLDAGNILVSSGHVLVHITADSSLSLAEIQTVIHRLSPHIADDSQVMLGVATDDSSDALGVTLMAGTHSGGRSLPEDDAEAVEEVPGEPVEELPGINGHARKPAKGEGRKGGKKALQPQQDELPLDQAMRGRFRDLTPTIEDGQDLDIPSFIRLRIRLK